MELKCLKLKHHAMVVHGKDFSAQTTMEICECKTSNTPSRETSILAWVGGPAEFDPKGGIEPKICSK